MRCTGTYSYRLSQPCAQNCVYLSYRETSSCVQQTELEDIEKKATDRRDNTMSIGMLGACIIHAITMGECSCNFYYEMCKQTQQIVDWMWQADLVPDLYHKQVFFPKVKKNKR